MRRSSAEYTRFRSAPEGLASIDADITFLGDPRHANLYERWERTRQQCAEVLVPDCIPPEHITSAYVSCEESRDQCEDLDVPWPLTLDPDKFFQT
jgi:ssDNA thymidine ADP-ribosyltransferase, DarT